MDWLLAPARSMTAHVVSSLIEKRSDTRLLDVDDPPATEPLENVRIELHAQDLDRAKSGWAAVIPTAG
jgi:hypothetical protein